MFLDWRNKSKSKKIPADAGRKSVRPGVKSGTLSMWGNSANHMLLSPHSCLVLVNHFMKRTNLDSCFDYLTIKGQIMELWWKVMWRAFVLMLTLWHHTSAIQHATHIYSQTVFFSLYEILGFCSDLWLQSIIKCNKKDKMHDLHTNSTTLFFTAN